MVQIQLKQKGKNRKLRIAKVRTKWESNILVADLFLTSGYVSAWKHLIMILQAAIQSNSGLASKLFITLTEGCGYDKICTFASVPARKTDYQAYLRKALKILNDMLLLKNMPADFPAEKI